MKYIMLKKEKEGMQHFVPVIFPNLLVHSEIAEALLSKLPDYVVHSAGEISSTGGNAYGSSDTLGVKSDPADTKRIQMYDYFFGME